MKITQLHPHRRKKKKSNIKIPTPVIYLLLLAVGLYFFIHSPFFDIKEIEVYGNNFVEKDDIIKLSQVNIGQNLIGLKKKAIREKISVHPLIKNVQLERGLPNTLNIHIEERQPVGFLVCPDGFIQVSADGYFLALMQDLGENNLPVISGIDIEQLPGPGQIIDNDGLFTVLNIIKESSSDLLENIVEFNIKEENHILAYSIHGIEIRLGSAERMTEKLDALNEIIQEIVNKSIAQNSIEYIDLRFSGPPIIKKK